MLVLTRKLNEAIIIDGEIRVSVLFIRGNQVRLGIEAPAEISIHREELLAPAEAVGSSPRRYVQPTSLESSPAADFSNTPGTCSRRS